MNKKHIVFSVSAVALMLVGLLVIAPYFIGKTVEQVTYEYAEVYTEQGSLVNVVIEEYQRGWFASRATLRVELPTELFSETSVLLDDVRIHHGPIVWQGWRPHWMLAGVCVTSDAAFLWESLLFDLLEYTALDPSNVTNVVTTKLLLRFNQDLIGEIDVPAINDSHDDRVLSWDGMNLAFTAFPQRAEFNVVGTLGKLEHTNTAVSSFVFTWDGADIELTLIEDDIDWSMNTGVIYGQNEEYKLMWDGMSSQLVLSAATGEGWVQVELGTLHIDAQDEALAWEGGILAVNVMVDAGDLTAAIAEFSIEDVLSFVLADNIADRVFMWDRVYKQLVSAEVTSELTIDMESGPLDFYYQEQYDEQGIIWEGGEITLRLLMNFDKRGVLPEVAELDVSGTLNALEILNADHTEELNLNWGGMDVQVVLTQDQRDSVMQIQWLFEPLDMYLEEFGVDTMLTWDGGEVAIELVVSADESLADHTDWKGTLGSIDMAVDIFGNNALSWQMDPVHWEGVTKGTWVSAYYGILSTALRGDFSSTLFTDQCVYIGDSVSHYAIEAPLLYLKVTEEGEPYALSFRDVVVLGGTDITANKGTSRMDVSVAELYEGQEVHGPVTMSGLFENFNVYELCMAQEALFELLEQEGVFKFIQILSELSADDTFMFDVILAMFDATSRFNYVLNVETAYGAAELEFITRLNTDAIVTDWLSSLFVSLDATISSELLAMWAEDVDTRVADVQRFIETGVLVEQDDDYQFNMILANKVAIINHDTANPLWL